MELASEREAKRKAFGAANDTELAAKMRKANEELWRHVSPAGTLGLPGLLDVKRTIHGIPDEAFNIQAVYDVIYLVQLPSEGGDRFFEGGLIIRPDTRKAHDDSTNPKAVIVSAGLRALDDIRSHGMDLGHTVYFQRLSPFRLEYASIGGVTYHFIVIVSGDITGSIDLMESIRNGDLETTVNEHGQHCWFSNPDNKTIGRLDREKE